MNGLWNRRLMAIVKVVVLISACGEQSSDMPPAPIVPIVPVIGQSSFVSADGPTASRDSNRAPLEDGAIYRVASDGKILSLSNYRGLQIIDATDPANPKIIGRVEVSGNPVDLHQAGDRVYVVLNDDKGYRGSGLLPERSPEGLLMVVDVSDPTKPLVTGRAEISGKIHASHVTLGTSKQALYVRYDADTTMIKGFSISTDGALEAKSEITLPHIEDIQTTDDSLIVSSDWNEAANSSRITLIDISSTDGVLVEGQPITVSGRVATKSNMDLHKGVLRVASGNYTRDTSTANFIQTFDATDIQNLAAIDEKTFGDGDQLCTTFFLDNKLFFVTGRWTHPFHAYEIADDGMITERSEFTFGGGDDFLKPFESDTRLISIAMNDVNGRKIAVSLFDISDLTNTNPILAREEIDLNVGDTTAEWDVFNYSVVENGTSVIAADGITVETGLVLLPFQGVEGEDNTYFSAVQLFTFSKTTLTKRGLLNHEGRMQDSFVIDQTRSTVANIALQKLSFHDLTSPDSPTELGSVEIAPNYTDLFVLGAYGLRRYKRDQPQRYGSSPQNPTDSVQVVALAGNVGDSRAIAEIQIPSNATLTLVGDILAVSSQNPNLPNGDYDTIVELWDFQPRPHQSSLQPRPMPISLCFMKIEGSIMIIWRNVADTIRSRSGIRSCIRRSTSNRKSSER